MSRRTSIGRYKGVDYRLQRICDMMASNSRVLWYFTYSGNTPTGDSFRTLGALYQAVDRNEVAI